LGVWARQQLKGEREFHSHAAPGARSVLRITACRATSLLDVDLGQIVPANKFDMDAADRAVALGWPGVEPVVAELLAWIQDFNWPVAHTLAPLLRSIGEPLAPYLIPILEGDDYVWKYWVIHLLLTEAPPGLLRHFTPLLERIADHPTEQERIEELDDVAATALGRMD